MSAPPAPERRSVLKTIKPYHVEVQSEAMSECKPNEVLVRTVASAVSAGTEMLVYRGQIPGTIAADTTLKHMKDTFQYPIAYGYCCAGRVVQVGSSVTKWQVGDLAFAFREHCDYFTATEDDLIRVPDGIDARDACLLPSIETAVSISFDAALLPGESAVVVGQGTIGLLVVACLKQLHPYSEIRAVEVQESRRVLSTADKVLDVEEATQYAAVLDSNPDMYGCDVSIDTSGSGAGLDTAISLTRDSGRVVIASWLGTKEVKLTSLGGRFHRSHCTMIVSQVSEIPVQLRARWTKQRRFELAWKLLKHVQPTKLLDISQFQFNDASMAFKEIDSGEHVQVVFNYE